MLLLILTICLFSCDKFLDIVPDDVATIQKSFKMRNQAKQALYACYHYFPKEGWTAFTDGFNAGPAFAGSDEFWIDNSLKNLVAPSASKIARGQQTVVNPALNFWEAGTGGPDLYKGIRTCNIFLKNIHKVGNMTQDEKKRWAAEV
jgi:hypothetical protein